MEGGQDLATPPIRVWSAAARAILATRLHGANLYSMGAGGFGGVPALGNPIRVQQPANANSHANQRIAELYAQGPLTIKQRFRT
jgi:hypothetical protein